VSPAMSVTDKKPPPPSARARSDSGSLALCCEVAPGAKHKKTKAKRKEDTRFMRSSGR
jgi:hypothetical protein